MSYQPLSLFKLVVQFESRSWGTMVTTTALTTAIIMIPIRAGIINITQGFMAPPQLSPHSASKYAPLTKKVTYHLKGSDEDSFCVRQREGTKDFILS